MCELCVRASRDVDGKNVFALAGRGLELAYHRQFADAASSATRNFAVDRQGGARLPGRRDPRSSASASPTPIGERLYDHEPISAEADALRRSRRASK